MIQEAGLGCDLAVVGRLNELAACERALATGMGGVVLVGTPGVGKTRLAREALATAQAAGFASWWVVASRATTSIPLGLWRIWSRPHSTAPTGSWFCNGPVSGWPRQLRVGAQC